MNSLTTTKKISIILIIIVTIGVTAGLVPLLINMAYKYDLGLPFFQTKWEANDALSFYGMVLTFGSSTILGLIVFWQNQRFKQENDKVQNRLERISTYANELNIIGKIVEHETSRLARVEMLFDEYLTACSPQTLAAVFLKKDSMVASATHEQIIDELFFRTARVLRIDPAIKCDDSSALKNSFCELYQQAKIMIETHRDGKKIEDGQVDMLVQVRDDFLREREKYLIKLEVALDHLLYDQLSLDEIKTLYKSSSGN